MNERVKIVFQLNPEDQQGYETEEVWAERVAANEFRVLNSPFFVYGISADDVVRAKPCGLAFEFDQVVLKGGHSTYRVFLQSGRTIHDESFRTCWASVAQMGGTFENANDRLISVDVPPTANIANVYKCLKRGEDDGVWEFEEGNHEGAVQELDLAAANRDIQKIKPREGA